MLIPAVLGVDAMAIEPNQTIPRVSDEGKRHISYVFVDDLQPLDHALPNAVLSVEPQEDGKAREAKIRTFDMLTRQCRHSGLLVIARSADRDSIDNRFLNPDLNPSSAGILSSRSFQEKVDDLSLENLFVTGIMCFHVNEPCTALYEGPGGPCDMFSAGRIMENSDSSKKNLNTLQNSFVGHGI
jgi:hypothetical protein